MSDQIKTLIITDYMGTSVAEPEEVKEDLKKYMPDCGSAKNPVDLTGMAGNDWYHDSVRSAYIHEWVDGLVVLYCETAMTDPQGIAESIHKAVNNPKISDKPVAVSFASLSSLPNNDESSICI